MTPVPAGAAEALAGSTGLDLPLARTLWTRGVRDAAGADRFLNPRLSDLSDPLLLPGMPAAVDRVWRAIADAEPITVYGDYDVDGVTGTALLVMALRSLGATVNWYLPNRIEEGYGLDADSLTRCLDACRPRLILTTDCGTGAREAVRLANKAGVDVVVTDHHQVREVAEEAVAVVNPGLGADASARCLAGVGVAFKFCHALIKTGRDKGVQAAAELDLRAYLDLVALGTIADVVPALGENRILVRHGLACLNRSGREGLKALAAVAGASGELGAYHVGFVLGPRMNAAGRMGNAETALSLLLAERREEALPLAAALDEANRLRKRTETEILESAIERIDAWFDPALHFGIVVGETGWHVGVVGIVASRLAARYGRPAVVVGFDENGMGRGSCRGIGGLDLMACLDACAGHLNGYGGHEKAAGLEIGRSAFDRFRETFHEACAAALRGRDLSPSLDLDAWVRPDEIADKRFSDAVDLMAPFGEGNAEPVWGVRDLRVLGSPRIVGDGHLKLLLGTGAVQIDAIGFGLGDREVPAGPIDVAAVLRKNTYMGRTTVQLHLKDFRPAA